MKTAIQNWIDDGDLKFWAFATILIAATCLLVIGVAILAGIPNAKPADDSRFTIQGSAMGEARAPQPSPSPKAVWIEQTR